MKIRNGFVSNSSTSSFMILGVIFESAEKLGVDELYNAEEKFPTKSKLDFGYGYDGDYVAIGRGPSHMKENETLKEFKEQILADLREGGVSVEYEDLGWHEDAYHDG